MLDRENMIWKINLILVGVKEIYLEHEEKQLHAVLKICYPHLVIKKKVNGVVTKEMYKFNYILWEEFQRYVPRTGKEHLKLMIEKEKTKQIEIQETERTKQEKEKTKQIEIQKTKKNKQEKKKTKQIEIQETERTKQEKEKTKQIEIQET